MIIRTIGRAGVELNEFDFTRLPQELQEKWVSTQADFAAGKTSKDEMYKIKDEIIVKALKQVDNPDELLGIVHVCTTLPAQHRWPSLWSRLSGRN